MIHKYKPCAWHIKKRRVNETLGRMIAEKYEVEYISPQWISVLIKVDVNACVNKFQKLLKDMACLWKSIASAFSKTGEQIVKAFESIKSLIMNDYHKYAYLMMRE